MLISIGHRMRLSSGRRTSQPRAQVKTTETPYIFKTGGTDTLNLFLLNVSDLFSRLKPPLSILDLTWDVLVCGRKNRNRAVHGDEVVVELLPKNEWRGKGTALTDGDEKTGEDNESTPLPTGGMFVLHSFRFDLYLYFMIFCVLYFLSDLPKICSGYLTNN